METKKITEGGILSAMQIVLGLMFIPTGIGYSFYIEVLLPITMTLTYLRCGKKAGMIAGLNTFLILGFGFGNIAIAIYALQALVFGFLTGCILQKPQSVQDDLMIESMIGCLFLLILDLLTAQILGHSLLDYDGIDEMVLSIMPEASSWMIQLIYYLSIASIPVATVLMTYIGSLILGYRLGFLSGCAREKYVFIKNYKLLIPFAYQGQKMVRWAVLGLIGDVILWPYATSAYLKAWIACSGAILLYFVLIDFSKLVDQYILEKWKKPLWLPIFHLLLLYAFFKNFIGTCCIIILIGIMIDFRTQIRRKQSQQLALYMRYSLHSK